MSFNDLDRISLKQLTPELKQLLLDAILESEFSNHVNNFSLHLTDQDRQDWELILQRVNPNGNKGQVYLINDDIGNTLIPDYIFKIGEFVNTSDDYNNAKLVNPPPEYIYDLNTNIAYRYTENNYTIISSTTKRDFIGRLLYNERTKKAFIIKNDEVVIEFLLETGAAEQFANLSLLKENNLSDLIDKSEARKNLGLYGDVDTHNHNSTYFTKEELLNPDADLGISANNIKEAATKKFVTETQIIGWDNSINRDEALYMIEDFYERLKIDITEKTDGSSKIKNYIDMGGFLNYPPKVGYFGEKKVPIYTSYNMPQVLLSRPSIMTSDNLGREIIYTTANVGKSEFKLYRATRTNGIDQFLYENSPISPSYLPPDQYVNSCMGLGNRYISYSVYDSINHNTKYHLVITNGKDYTEWIDYKDITSLIEVDYSKIYSVIYFDDYGTFAIIYHTTLDRKIFMKLYNYNTLNLISTKELVDYNTLINFTGYTELSFSNINTIFGGAMYNNLKEQLVISAPKFVSGVYEGEFKTHYRDIIHIINIPKTFFNNGDGELTDLILPSEYKWDMTGIGITLGQPYSVFATYDDYDDCIRACYRKQYSYLDEIYITNNVNRPITNKYFTDYSYYLESSTPDYYPWEKIIYSSIMMGDNLYLNCESFRHKSSICCVEYDKDVINNELKLLNDKLWLTRDKEVNDINNYPQESYQCQRALTTPEVGSPYYETIWSLAHPGKDLLEISFDTFIDNNGNELKGLRKTSKVGYISELPSKYTYCGSCCYNSITEKAYFLVCDVTPVDPEKLGYSYILEYNYNTEEYKEHRNTPASWETLHDNSKSYTRSMAISYSKSNMMIDIDNSIYFILTVGAFKKLCKITPQEDGSIIYNIGSMNLVYESQIIQSNIIGWNSNFGYYISEDSLLFLNTATFHTSKDYIENGLEKTMTQLFNNDKYSVYIKMYKITGLSVYIQSMPILLGGHFSILERQKIDLKPNKTNYIYLTRDRSNPRKINISVREYYIGIEGENGFNRILISKFITDSNGVISQEDYEI